MKPAKSEFLYYALDTRWIHGVIMVIHRNVYLNDHSGLLVISRLLCRFMTYVPILIILLGLMLGCVID